MNFGGCINWVIILILCVNFFKETHTDNGPADEDLPANSVPIPRSSSSSTNSTTPCHKRKLNLVVEQAFETMNRLAQNSNEIDKCNVFGEYVGHQIRKIRSER